MNIKIAEAIARIVSIPEGGHSTWPSGLHSTECRGCESRNAKRQALEALGVSKEEAKKLLPYYGQS